MEGALLVSPKVDGNPAIKYQKGGTSKTKSYILSSSTFFDINLEDIVFYPCSVYPGFWDPDFDAVINQYRVVGFV